MLGSAVFLDDVFVPLAQIKLRLIVMPEAAVKGLCYDPQWTHPLQKPTAVILEVTDLGNDNGLYKVPVSVSESFFETQASLCKTQRVKGKLPSRDRHPARFTASEIEIDPQAGDVDLAANPSLRDSLVSGMRKFYGRTRLTLIS